MFTTTAVGKSSFFNCCVVWHSSITVEESSSIERVQKTALRIILRGNFTDYKSALQLTGLDRLQDRRTKLSLTFAKKCLKNGKNEDLFPLNVKSVNTRQHKKYFVIPDRTEHLAKSAVPYLQGLLNNQ